MTSRIFKSVIAAFIIIVATAGLSMAQNKSVAELMRVEAMYPDKAIPKYQVALECLNQAIMNPADEKTEMLLAEAGKRISDMEKMKDSDKSDICTLKGFLSMVRIVQNPAQNGQKYYLDVMTNFEKALKLNPENELAKRLQQKFFEGMSKSM